MRSPAVRAQPFVTLHAMALRRLAAVARLLPVENQVVVKLLLCDVEDVVLEASGGVKQHKVLVAA